MKDQCIHGTSLDGFCSMCGTGRIVESGNSALWDKIFSLETSLSEAIEERDRLKEENQHFKDNAGITAYYELKDDIYHRYDNWANKFQEKFPDVGMIDEEGQFVGYNIIIPQFIREMVFSLEEKLKALESSNALLKEENHNSRERYRGLLKQFDKLDNENNTLDSRIEILISQREKAIEEIKKLPASHIINDVPFVMKGQVLSILSPKENKE